MSGEEKLSNPNPLNNFYIESRECDGIPDCDDFTDEKYCNSEEPLRIYVCGAEWAEVNGAYDQIWLVDTGIG